ncbi:hypothetical protein J0910_11605 [Nocardiopsis sp. CNT-189]|uniref:hypothetical protein n=1 Tax=Nocardiopsis oceanisediminis TaxID=2816862 RepID=UPI003B292A33
MAWSWRYEKDDGEVLRDEELPAEVFTSRGDAESWLGEEWRGLAEAGVGRVSLLEDERVHYSMPLSEEV